MKTSRFRHSYRQNASRLHKQVGDILRNSDVFGDFEVYQEYPVNRINTNYPSGRHHFDWVIPGLKLVVECHGEQHFMAVAWDGDKDKAEAIYKEGKVRDKAKKDAAIDAGYLYIMIPYNVLNRIDIKYIVDQIELAKLIQSQYTGQHYEKSDEQNLLEKLTKELKEKKKAARASYLQSEAYKQRLEEARKHRQKRYKNWKAVKKERERLKNE